RIIRIVPPYYAAIALCAIAASCTGFNVLSPSAIPSVSAYDIVRQALFIDANVHLLNGSFWSLAVEFRWYFLFPVFLWLWVRSPRAFFLAGAGLALAALLTRAQSLDLLFLPTFMLGIVAAAAFLAKQRTKTWLVWLVLFSVLAFVKSRNDGWAWTTNPIWGIAMFWLVLGAAGSPYISTLFSHRWLTKIGYGSYAIYLTHEPVIRFLSPHLAFLKNDWAAFGVLTSIALVFGLAFSYIAERPFTKGRLRDHLVGALERGLTQSFLRITGTCHLPLLTARHAGTRVKAA
ncbi:MAG TPA: acyltransferase family protein, partial [Candidatus Baltobacteraceae bacterium]|nr:acyltransferase family protein [Candidatus Baltobacteraceae bacterium]